MTQKLENEQIYFIIYGDFIPHPEKKWTVLLWDCFRETGNGTGWNVHLWVHLVPIDFLMGHGIPQTVEVTLFRGSMKEMHISGRKRAENGKYYFALKEAIKHDGFETLSSCCQHFSSPLGWTVWWSCPEGHNLFIQHWEKNNRGPRNETAPLNMLPSCAALWGWAHTAFIYFSSGKDILTNPALKLGHERRQLKVSKEQEE